MINLNVVDDFLTTNQINEMHDVVLNNSPWRYRTSNTLVGNTFEAMHEDGTYTTHDSKDPSVTLVVRDHKTLEMPQISCMFFGVSRSPDLNHGGPVFDSLFRKLLTDGLIKSPYERLIRAKANLQLKHPFCPREMYNYPHTDAAESNLSLILYLNDSDGDTIIFKEKSYDSSVGLNEYARVTPKKNRCVIFNSSYLHSSSPPIYTDYRLIANLVFKKEVI